MIRTDSEVILAAAEEAGFIAQGHQELAPRLCWQIASERSDVAASDSDTCEATVAGNSLYLSMGQGQWFALDLETGDGAGLVARDTYLCGNRNAVRYLRTIACKAEPFVRPKRKWEQVE